MPKSKIRVRGRLIRVPQPSARYAGPGLVRIAAHGTGLCASRANNLQEQRSLVSRAAAYKHTHNPREAFTVSFSHSLSLSISLSFAPNAVTTMARKIKQYGLTELYVSPDKTPLVEYVPPTYYPIGSPSLHHSH